eukprot:scaffold235979_cov17-Prasinocladus_malaysianus.AAC.2
MAPPVKLVIIDAGGAQDMICFAFGRTNPNPFVGGFVVALAAGAFYAGEAGAVHGHPGRPGGRRPLPQRPGSHPALISGDRRCHTRKPLPPPTTLSSHLVLWSKYTVRI